jgi:hypothetical protein
MTLAPPARGLHVPVQIELPFAELSRRVTASLASESAGQGVTVRDVAIWGVGDTAVVQVDLGGRVNGALHLVGRFAYDAPSRRVLLRDLRYTVASRDLATRLKATLGAPLVKRAIDDATGHGRLDVGAQLDEVRRQLTRELNREIAPGTYLGGGITSVQIASVHTLPSAFVVRVVLDGDVRLVVQ